MRHLVLLAVVALTASAACATPAEDAPAVNSEAELRLGMSAEQVLATIEREGLFTSTGGPAPAWMEVRFKDDVHLSNELRHKYSTAKMVSNENGESAVERDSGVVKISWHATPSWEHPLAGYWTVDLQSNAASPTAPAKYRFKFERGVADYILTEENTFLKVVSTSGHRVSCRETMESKNVAACIELVPLGKTPSCEPDRIVRKGQLWMDEFQFTESYDSMRGSGDACLQEFTDAAVEDGCCAG
jgi:hypothetical protein